MDQISEHINSSDYKIHFYGLMGKMIGNLSNRKCNNNNKSIGHLNQSHKSLLMSIFETPEKDASNVDWKVDKRKIRSSLINSSSTLFSFSICPMYNIIQWCF